LVAVLKGANFVHAIVGYRAPNEPEWEGRTIGDLRRAVEYGDAVFFEATGAIEADAPVGAETQAERSGRVLSFTEAKEAAKRMVKKPKIRLIHLLDVYAQRGQRQKPQ